MWLIEQTLNVRPFRIHPEDLEALTPNSFLLARAVVAEPLMTGSARYIDCRKIYKVAQAHNQMIWNIWAREYLSNSNVRPKRVNEDERTLRVGDLVWLIDESVRRHENKKARVAEVFPGADTVVRSASIKTADRVLRSPAVKMVPVFYECFQKERRADDVGAKRIVNE